MPICRVLYGQFSFKIRDMQKSVENVDVYLKFLNLVRALEGSPGFPSLDSMEEQLLKELALEWNCGKRVTVLEAMNLFSDISNSTIHRRLKSMKRKGVISLEVDELDNRVKYVMPTALANSYFQMLGSCVLKLSKIG